jgi:hypothetical protein
MTTQPPPDAPSHVQQRLQALLRQSDALRWRMQWEAEHLSRSVWAPWAARAGLFALRTAWGPARGALQHRPQAPWSQRLLREALGWVPLGLHWLAPALAQAAWRRWLTGRATKGRVEPI